MQLIVERNRLAVGAALNFAGATVADEQPRQRASFAVLETF
jgi:hypothetical protein